jgi:hypothetical protein
MSRRDDTKEIVDRNETMRTALRLWVLMLDHGAALLPRKVAQSPEAATARKALYTASSFLTDEYDQRLLGEVVEQLRQGLLPLAAIGYGPFGLYVLTFYRRSRPRKRARRGADRGPTSPLDSTVIQSPFGPGVERERPDE